MISNQLIAILKDHQELSEVSMDELRALKDRYPYFQTAYLLLAKKAVNKNVYEKQYWIHTAATFANSRSVLYNLLHDKDLFQRKVSETALTEEGGTEREAKETEQELPLPAVEQEATGEAIEEVQELAKKPVPEEAEIPPVLVNEETDRLYREAYERRLQDMAEEEKLLIEEEEENPDLFVEKVQEESEVEIPQALMVEKTDRLPTEAYERRLQDMEMDEELPTEEIQIDRALLAEKARRQLEMEMEMDLVEEGQAEQEEEEEAWDLFSKDRVQKKVADDLDAITIEKETEQAVVVPNRDTHSLLQDLKNTVASYKSKKRRSPFSEDDAQEIKEYVTQHSAQESTLTVEEQVALSIQDSEKVKTEAMATVFEKQGHYHKAAEIYKELSLKYPEKKSYFAGKIANINNKL